MKAGNSNLVIVVTRDAFKHCYKINIMPNLVTEHSFSKYCHFFRFRSEIDRLITSDTGIFEYFQSHKMDAARISLLGTALTSSNRLKRDTQSNDTSNSNSTMNGIRIDCSSVCCVSEDMTPPFSHIKTYDGWEPVASTPQFPQRVSFYTETCIRSVNP